MSDHIVGVLYGLSAGLVIAITVTFARAKLARMRLAHSARRLDHWERFKRSAERLADDPETPVGVLADLQVLNDNVLNKAFVRVAAERRIEKRKASGRASGTMSTEEAEFRKTKDFREFEEWINKRPDMADVYLTTIASGLAAASYASLYHGTILRAELTDKLLPKRDGKTAVASEARSIRAELVHV